jgi:hypothetical protein
LDKIYRDIYKYYPAHIQYDTEAYRNSEQSKRRYLKIDDKAKQEQAKNAILRGLYNAMPNYNIIDWTVEKSCCYELKVLLHENQPILDDDIKLIQVLGGLRNDLRIFISILEPFYFMFLETTQYDVNIQEWKFESNYLNRDNDIVSSYRNYLNQGYELLEYKKVTTVVNDIATELKNIGEATVFDCMFTDLVSLE